MSDLYNRIYDLCQERNISVGKMCNELGISRGNLTELKMDRIKTLKADNLTKISGFFGVSIDYLLGTETKKAPTQEGEREIGFDDFTYAFYEAGQRRPHGGFHKGQFWRVRENIRENRPAARQKTGCGP